MEKRREIAESDAKLQIALAGLDLQADDAINPLYLNGWISNALRRWAREREDAGDPPSVAEVRDQLRLWLAVADRLAWIDAHGDAAPERPLAGGG